jgi:hypothetical protein
MKKIFHPFLVPLLSISFVLASCTHDPPVTPFNVAALHGTYKISQWYAVDSLTHNFYYLYDSLPLCQKAVLIQLNNDSTYMHIHNGSSCSVLPPFMENGVWNAVQQNIAFIVDSNRLSLSYTDGKQISFWYHGSYQGKPVDFSETLTKQ